MMIPSAVFEGVNRLGLDTSPCIYFVERHPVYLSMMRDIIERIDAGIMAGYASVITLAEVLVHPKREGKIALENEYRDILQNSQNFELIPIDASIADRASDLRSRHDMRTTDAPQIAAVLAVGCEAFFRFFLFCILMLFYVLTRRGTILLRITTPAAGRTK